MKLYVSPRAPNPRRVLMFLVEKNINGLDLVNVDLNAQEHKTPEYRAKTRWPACPRWSWTTAACSPKPAPSAPSWKAACPSPT